MTEDRVPTQSLDDTLRAWGLDPANFIESLTGWGYEIRLVASAQPAPPHRFVAAYFGDPDRDPACGRCRKPFVEHREQPAPPLGMHGGDHECRLCGLPFPLEQPAPHIDTITRHDWRLVLWESHGHDALYGDDGEMQCPHYPPADFLRDHVDSLIAHIAWSLSLPDSAPSRSEPEVDND